MQFFRNLKKINHKRQFVFILLTWSLLMMAAMFYDFFNQIKQKEELVIMEAKIAFEKDVVFRKWATMHGGVYVPVSDKTRPNPYLSIAERDITLPSGRKLTLMNPAYMIRQVYEIEKEKGNLVGHITSLNPINPINKPSEWEKNALKSFHSGAKEYKEFVEENQLPYLRYMRPFYVTKPCLKCHAAQGYHTGDIRGGVSVVVPLEKINAIYNLFLLKSWGVYFFLWLFGIAGLWGTFRFIDEQFGIIKQKEKELEKFKSAMEQVQDIVMMVDPESMKPVYANPFARKTLGYLEKLPEIHICDLFEHCDAGKLNGMKKDSILAKITDGERNIVCKDGRLIPVELKVDLVETRDGDQYIIIMARDISPRKKLEAEKERLNVELLSAHKLESVGQLAAGIAHEINTPTQYVGTNLDFFSEAFSDISELVEKYQEVIDEAIKAGCLDTDRREELEEAIEEADWEYLMEEVPEAIKQSQEGVKRVTSIVRAMKNFSHPGSGVKEPEDINSLIETTVTISRNEWKYVADIELDLDETLPPVPCLHDYMSQVFLNMIVNAAHAIGEKQGETSEDKHGLITIKTRKLDDFVEIVIADTGKGMSEEVKRRIFEPFYTTKEVGKGTGQGLSIAWDIVVEKHGGKIDVESEPGAGAKFIITLPLNE